MRGKVEMLRAGVIGLGVGERHIFGFNRSRDAVTVRICDQDPNKLAEVAARTRILDTTTDPNDILLDPTIDIVSIASFDECHAEQVIIAINAGKHIFVEKPICLTLEELDAICGAYSQSVWAGLELKISSNFILRCEERFIKLKRRIDSGELGEIYAVEGNYDYGRVKKLLSGWRSNTPGYSVMHGGGIHLLDLCQWLTGEMYQPTAALNNKVVTHGTSFKPPDTIFSIGKFGDKIIGRIGANFGSQTAHFHQLKVYGTKGTFIHDCAKTTYFFGSEPGEIREVDSTPFPSSNKGDLLPDFVASIMAGDNFPINFEYIESIMRTSISIDSLALNK